MPTQTTSGFFGSTVTQPIEYEPCWSKTGVKVLPAFTVFHTPPEATATYQVAGWAGWTARSMTRPEFTAGPISRSSSPVKVSGFSRLSGPACAADFAGAAGLPWTSAAVTGRAARVASTSSAARVRLMVLLPPFGRGWRREAQVPGTDGAHSRPCAAPGVRPPWTGAAKGHDERARPSASAPGPDVVAWGPAHGQDAAGPRQLEPASGTP